MLYIKVGDSVFLFEIFRFLNELKDEDTNYKEIVLLSQTLAAKCILFAPEAIGYLSNICRTVFLKPHLSLELKQNSIISLSYIIRDEELSGMDLLADNDFIIGLLNVLKTPDQNALLHSVLGLISTFSSYNDDDIRLLVRGFNLMKVFSDIFKLNSEVKY